MTTLSNLAKTCRAKAGKPRQGALPFRRQRGGSRAGAGRKPKGEKAGVSHARRTLLPARFPAHVTLKLLRGLPRLRSKDEYAALRAAFAAGCTGCARAASGDFRLCHYAVLNDHLHLLVEAQDRRALSRGLQGLAVRIAKALNRLWRRRGTVFADRYHDRILKTPREVRNALCYVLGNGKKHAAEGREVHLHAVIDTFTSAPWFDGFRERVTVRGLDKIERPTTDARSWMLTIGWRRHGLLSVHELPATG
jgi:REP element-mobilizing transposase RayT